MAESSVNESVNMSMIGDNIDINSDDSSESDVDTEDDEVDTSSSSNADCMIIPEPLAKKRKVAYVYIAKFV